MPRKQNVLYKAQQAQKVRALGGLLNFVHIFFSRERKKSPKSIEIDFKRSISIKSRLKTSLADETMSALMILAAVITDIMLQIKNDDVISRRSS